MNLSSDLYETIIDSCQFLYEKSLLKIATDVLSAEETDYEKIVTESELFKVLSLVKAESKLDYNIQTCLFEIYCLSDFNERICHLLTIFKDIMIK